MSGRVFVVQNQHRYDSARRALVPKYDMSDAERFGELVDLLGPTAHPFDPEPVVRELDSRLADYDDSDCLLLVGNPILIGLAVAVAADVNDGRVSMLQWSGKDQCYQRVEAVVYNQRL